MPEPTHIKGLLDSRMAALTSRMEGNMETEKKKIGPYGQICPLLLNGWLSKYGNYDPMGDVYDYCHCSNDCAWYDGLSDDCRMLQQRKED